MSLYRIGNYLKCTPYEIHRWNWSALNARPFCLILCALMKSRGLENENCSINRRERRSRAEALLHDSVTSIDENEDQSIWSSPLYPKCEISERNQSQKRLLHNVDPAENTVVIFPGQGTQYKGMGRTLAHFPESKVICDLASDFLGYDLLEVCASGPQEKLNRTEFSQMAVFVLSYAAAENLKSEQPGVFKKCIATAGFSVGEITSLVFSGAITFSEALMLVKVRAEAMQVACDSVKGGMMTVFYGPDSRLEYACLCATQWCAERGIENPVCKIANYLFPHCKVVAGHVEALSFIEKHAHEYKLKRIKRLPVSGAFHTPLMKSAAEPFKKALKQVNILRPTIPVYSNVDGNMYRNAHQILLQLPKQIYKPVKWEQTLHTIYARAEGQKFPSTFECGPGSSLKTCLKMVNAKAWAYCQNIPV